MKLRIGSRGSDLALTQSRYIQSRIRELPGSPDAEIIIIKTSGDRIQNAPLSSLGDTPDERKGFFTKELEDALLADQIDLAVHSYKDLPTEDPLGLMVAAIPQRVSARDVLIFSPEKRATDSFPFLSPGASIGTASVRRSSQLRLLRPDLKCVAVRGNLPTRLYKLREGRTPRLGGGPEETETLDAIMLAEAGLNRLRAEGVFDRGEHAGLLDDFTIEPLPPELFVPAPAQGALALQCRAQDETTRSALEQLHDALEADCVGVERAVLAGLRGGCHLPLGAYCLRDDSGYALRGFLGEEAEDNRRKASYAFVRKGADPEALARRVLRDIQEGTPVVLTGRADRLQELREKFSGESVHLMPLLEMERLSLGPEQNERLSAWLDGAARLGDKESALIAAFSAPGAEAFASLPGVAGHPGLSRAVWATTGERTSSRVASLFPGARTEYMSPDGTGEALARLLLEKRGEFSGPVLALAAERGRPEFFDLFQEAGIETEKLTLYKSRGRIPETKELEALPREANVIFGSPSAVQAFFESLGRSGPGEEEFAGLRFCALGKTTARALRESGREVYAEAATPDYESFVRELL